MKEIKTKADYLAMVAEAEREYASAVGSVVDPGDLAEEIYSYYGVGPYDPRGYEYPDE